MENLEQYILKNYRPENGSLSALTSQGNGDDQFADGYDVGVAVTLFKIAGLIGMKIEALESPNLY